MVDFNSEELKHFLAGGVENYRFMEKVVEVIKNEKELQNDEEWYQMSRVEQMKKAFNKVERLNEVRKSHSEHKIKLKNFTMILE
jgi:hypothetical protein